MLNNFNNYSILLFIYIYNYIEVVNSLLSFYTNIFQKFFIVLLNILGTVYIINDLQVNLF